MNDSVPTTNVQPSDLRLKRAKMYVNFVYCNKIRTWFCSILKTVVNYLAEKRELFRFCARDKQIN